VTWTGVLVRTGVYREGDETNGAAVVCDGVKQAVDWILEQEKLTPSQDSDSPSGKRQKR
jgi:ribonucleotide monophosphatase NagD (HAD superfamily)